MIISTTEKILNFTAAVRVLITIKKYGHQRKEKFSTAVKKVIMVKTESKNGPIVGHLPREVSRITKFV